MIKESIIEHVKHRLFVVTVLFLVLFGILIYRLFDLQIVNGEKYQESFTYKSVKTVAVKATRGNIYDCNGKLLAYNEASYTLSYISGTDLTEAAAAKETTSNELRNDIVYKTILILEQNGDKMSVSLPLKLTSKGFEFTVSGNTLNTFLMNVYGASSVDSLTEEQASSTADDIFKYMRGKDLFNISETYSDEAALKILAVRYEIWLNRYQQYMSVQLADGISEESYAAIKENSDELLGMEVSVESHRVYNDSVYFAQIIGYIGNISNEELEKYNETLDDSEKYSANDMVGKMGLESEFESYLRGKDGYQKMYVDNMGKVIEVIDSKDPVAGNDIYLTIDSDLQKYCYNALETEIASILLAHIKNVTTSTDKDDIPITDVYFALFDNNVISIDDLAAKDASELEQSVNSYFQSAKQNTLSRLDDILNVSHTPLHDLTLQYQDYMEFICEQLSEMGIYNPSKIDKSDAAYVSYINNSISLCEYLKYAISQGAIDISGISTKSDYYDTDEIYNVLTEYILKEFENNTSFDKLVFKYMIISGELTGSQVINLLYDQGILNMATDADYSDYKAGVMGSYDFICKKIKNLEITPAMLALDPCSGSIVVTNPNNGTVKAMTSYPSYDNNRLTNMIDADYYSKITTDKTTPMYSRATMQQTAPGSTFKMITAFAGMNEGVIGVNDVIQTKGYFDKTETPAKCWIYPSAHGTIGISKAIEESCNYFFYELGYRMATKDTGTYSDITGVERLQKYAGMFGFDSTSGIELPESKPQISDADSIRTAIGQGTNNFTATQLARYVTTLANSGTCYDLSLVSEIKDIDGNVVYKNEHKVQNQLDFPVEQWNVVRQGMRQVVSVHTSSSALINQINVAVAGKTGTAQQSEARPNHALFVSFAPYENPEVTVTSVIPFGYSSGNAVELSGLVYAYLYDPDVLENTTITGNNALSD
ncbi:penicillin-binding transpeptidase domain-containing protein [Clostridium sp. L2-50]|uniref:penicillin-binding transpeptidase domain-containing protein n=1 Tax=Clostridium sp. L2-50 TaxID=411489 RepID=UPI00238160C5|nr:penicillin-binding transpeptidase domain-containing protein [Clostridium sp. L2-50]